MDIFLLKVIPYKGGGLFEAFTYIKTDSCSHSREHHRRVCDCGIHIAEESDRRRIDGVCHHFESFLRIEHFLGRADLQRLHVFRRGRFVRQKIRFDDDPEHNHFSDIFNVFPDSACIAEHD